MQYNEKTFQWILIEKTAIEQVAKILGVSVTSIAGAMAKERYEWDNNVKHIAVNPHDYPQLPKSAMICPFR